MLHAPIYTHVYKQYQAIGTFVYVYTWMRWCVVEYIYIYVLVFPTFEIPPESEIRDQRFLHRSLYILALRDSHPGRVIRRSSRIRMPVTAAYPATKILRFTALRLDSGSEPQTLAEFQNSDKLARYVCKSRLRNVLQI